MMKTCTYQIFQTGLRLEENELYAVLKYIDAAVDHTPFVLILSNIINSKDHELYFDYLKQGKTKKPLCTYYPRSKLFPLKPVRHLKILYWWSHDEKVYKLPQFSKQNLWRIDSDSLFIMNRQLHFCTRSNHVQAI